MGRSSALTPQVQERIIEAIKLGETLAGAAQRGGIDPATMRRWIAQADDADDEPPLTHMAIEELRKLAKQHGIPYGPRTKRSTLARQLEEADVHAWDHYRAFRAAVRDAEAQARVRMIAGVNQAMFPEGKTPDGKLILQFLARRWPKEWAPAQAVEVSGPGGGPINVSVEHALAERVQAFLNGGDVIDVDPVDELEAGDDDG